VMLSIAAPAAASKGVLVTRIDAGVRESRPHTPHVAPYVVTPGRITFTVILTNRGLVPVTLIALGSEARPLASPVALPLEIAPGRQAEVRLAYEIPNCARFPTGPYTVRVRRRRAPSIVRRVS
jgi:hypothetical protein